MKAQGPTVPRGALMADLTLEKCALSKEAALGKPR